MESTNIDPVIVVKTEVWMCRDGKGIVSDHIPHSEHPYHNVSGRETRYCIRYCDGSSCYLPHRIYQGPLETDCYFASGVVEPTRRYIREIDKSYFKYWDDADEIRNNIILFLSWLKNPPTIKPKVIAKIQEENEHLLRQRPVVQEWMNLNLTDGSKEKKRSDLDSFTRYLADQEDLLEDR